MLKATFCGLIGVFLVITSAIVFPVFRKYLSAPFFITSWVAFFLLGAALIFLTVRKKVKGKLKKFLILTGVSAVGFLVSVLLHNFLYGLAIITSSITVLSFLMKILHVIFFIVAILVCPIGFLIGAAGSATLFVKKKTKTTLKK